MSSLDRTEARALLLAMAQGKTTIDRTVSRARLESEAERAIRWHNERGTVALSTPSLDSSAAPRLSSVGVAGNAILALGRMATLVAQQPLREKMPTLLVGAGLVSMMIAWFVGNQGHRGVGAWLGFLAVVLVGIGIAHAERHPSQ